MSGRACLFASLCCVVFSLRVGADTYWAHGYHGGYYLTDEEMYRACLDRLFTLLDKVPHYKAVLEIEPYTLERMLNGEKFACERHGRDKLVLVGWSYGGQGKGWQVTRLREAGKTGFGMRLTFSEGAYVNCCQPLSAADLRGHSLVLAANIRAHRGTGAHLYLDAHGASGFLPGSSGRSEPAPPDGQWHEVKVKVTVPTQAVTVFPQVKLDGAPTEADFDDVSLIDTQTGKELLRNGDFEQAEVPNMRDTERLRRLRELIRAGRAEIVGGAYTQPILYTIGDESAVRQFTYGCRAVEQALSVPVRFYAAQESGMAGQLPQLLNQAGFEGVLYRTCWAIFGSPPHRDAEVVAWVGPDGSRIPAVPAYGFTPLAGYGLPGEPTPGLVRDAAKAGISNPLFSVFGDFVPNWVPSPDAQFLTGEVGSGWANLCRSLPAEALRGREVVLSGSVRARQPGAHLYIDAHNEQHRATSSAQSDDVPPDGQWHRAQLRFRVPGDAVLLFPQGRIIATSGDADFDGLSLKATGNDAELLPMGSFEEEKLSGGWGLGQSEEVKAEHEVVRGDAAEGERFVQLRMKAPITPVKFATLAEYFGLAGKPQTEWRDAYADFQHRFPFGLLAGEPQRADREAEDAVLRAERVCALFGYDAHKELDDAWELTLMQEHHDGWVCAPVLFGAWRGYSSYAEMCETASKEAQAVCQRLLDTLRVRAAPDQARISLGELAGASVTVLNATGASRTGLLNLDFSLPSGAAKTPALFGADGNPAPAKVQVLSRHADGSAKEVSVWLVAGVPSLGGARYEIREGQPAPLDKTGTEASSDSVTLRTKSLQVRVSREGLIEVADSKGSPLLRAPVSLAGRFTEAATSVVENVSAEKGDGVVTSAVARGHIGTVPFTSIVRLFPYSRLVRLTLEFDFGNGTEVGAREDLEGSPRFARNEEKLRLVVPLPFASPRFYTHGAFEIRPVTRERHVALRYAVAEGEGRGVAILTDRATAVVCRANPPSLEVVLAYGGGFIYAPNERAPLIGKHSFNLALAFSEGSYDAAGIPQLAEEFSQPLLVSAEMPRLVGQKVFSKLSLAPPRGAVLTAAYGEGNDLLLRLWRPAADPGEVRMSVAGAKSLWATDLRASRKQKLGAGSEATLSLRPQEVVTVRAAFR